MKNKYYILIILTIIIFIYLLANSVIPENAKIAAEEVAARANNEISNIYGNNYNIAMKRWNSRNLFSSITIYYKIRGKAKKGVLAISLNKRNEEYFVTSIKTWETSHAFKKEVIINIAKK